jgi:ribosomal-protein-alanine N-acetyltransferase
MRFILETERLTLREYTEADAPEFFQLNTDPQVMRYVPDPPMKSQEEARQVIRSHPMADYAEFGYGRWACIFKTTAEHIGFCGLKHLKELHEIDLGFRFRPAVWGKGLATEAARACADYGFDQLGVKEMIGLSHPDNTGSMRVLEKVGMQFTGLVSPYGWPMNRYVLRR